MSNMCANNKFWINKDKSVIINMDRIVSIVRLDIITMQPNQRRCEYGVYTTHEKEMMIPITVSEHKSLLEALQEEYTSYEMRV